MSNPLQRNSGTDRNILATSETSSSGRAKRSRPAVERPQRPLNAYNYFFQDERKKMLEEQCGSSASRPKSSEDPVSFAGMARTVSKRWKAINETDKAHYQRLADEDKSRYYREMTIWYTQNNESSSNDEAETGNDLEESSDDSDGDRKPRAEDQPQLQQRSDYDPFNDPSQFTESHCAESSSVATTSPFFGQGMNFGQAPNTSGPEHSFCGPFQQPPSGAPKNDFGSVSQQSEQFVANNAWLQLLQYQATVPPRAWQELASNAVSEYPTLLGTQDHHLEPSAGPVGQVLQEAKPSHDELPIVGDAANYLRFIMKDTLRQDVKDTAAVATAPFGIVPGPPPQVQQYYKQDPQQLTSAPGNAAIVTAPRQAKAVSSDAFSSLASELGPEAVEFLVGLLLAKDKT